MTFWQARDRLRQHTVRAVRPGLSRTKKMLAWMGSPDRNLPAVQIAGSNGKGSVSAMLAAVFSQAGYRIGQFTSPHLHDERERITLNGKKVSAALFVQAVTRLLPALKRLEREKDPATTFEAWTVLAAIIFQMNKVELVILETGMGGRLDATTVWQYKILTVLTNIHLEHTEFLGETRQAICKEKLGIIRKSVPLVTAVPEKDLRAIIRQTAKKKSVPVMYAGQNPEDAVCLVRSKDLPSGTAVELRHHHKIVKFQVPLRGTFQGLNTGLAYLAATQIADLGFAVSQKAMKSGIARTIWPGRMEKIADHPAVFLDGSHNPAAAEAVVSKWISKKRRINLIVGIMQDKAVNEMVRHYSQVAKKVWTVLPLEGRGLSAVKLADLFKENRIEAVSARSVNQAVRMAMTACTTQDTLLVTGSLYILDRARHAVCQWYQKKSV